MVAVVVIAVVSQYVPTVVVAYFGVQVRRGGRRCWGTSWHVTGVVAMGRLAYTW